jgi:hypothetical protein
VAAAKVVEDKVVVAAADARVVGAEAAKVEEVRAAAVVDVLAAVVDKVAVDKVAVDKVVADKVGEEVAVARVVAADPPAVVVEWEVEAAVADAPVVAGAAETVSSLPFSGASRACGAPFFC